MDNGDVMQQPEMLARLSRLYHRATCDQFKKLVIRPLERGEDLIKIGRPFMNFSSAEEKHIRNDWLDDVKGWWPKQRAEELLRVGLRDAARYCCDFRIPAHFFWITGFNGFDVKLKATSEQVTVLICSPEPPTSLGPHLHLNDDTIRIIQQRPGGVIDSRFGKGAR